MIETVAKFDDRGITLRPPQEPIVDTVGPMSRAFLGVMAVFVQLRVDPTREDTVRGLAHSRKPGRVGGRPTVIAPERIAAASYLRATHPPTSYAQIAHLLGGGATNVHRPLD